MIPSSRMTLRQEWENLARQMFTHGEGEAQQSTIRAAFFAGAWAVLAELFPPGHLEDIEDVSDRVVSMPREAIEELRLFNTISVPLRFGAGRLREGNRDARS